MTRLASTPLKDSLRGGLIRYGMADRMLEDIESYEFDLDTVGSYDPQVREQIRLGVQDLRGIKAVKTTPHILGQRAKLEDQALHADTPLERDQAVWNLTTHHGAQAIEVVARAIEEAPTPQLATSALLALMKLTHHGPERVLGTVRDLASHSNPDLAEWARLQEMEIEYRISGDLQRLSEPASRRGFRYEPGQTFDVTMPLVFHCHAYTRIGPLTYHTVVSPTWFSDIFGDAMACVRQETFSTNLVLEKLVSGLHPDGSPHFEHFPFSGRTDHRTPWLHHHNYWAQLYRPFYTSGRTELVDRRHPVIPRVPMTFCREACTLTPAKYQVNGKPIPESVRGIFFGYGHIAPSVLLKNRLRIGVGDFQLSSRTNPATGKLANTYFYGTFFGKLGDWDRDGLLDVNTRPVHCDATGRLDYSGDGTMGPDPFRPDDW